MVCPNCNSVNSGQNCYVHNVLTCLNCLYDGIKSFCDEPSFIEQSKKYIDKHKTVMDDLLDRVKAGGDMWVPQ